MGDTRNQLSTALQILFSETTDLRMLADMSGYPAESFYRGADLRGIDLKDADLTGLNFLGANLLTANLDNVIFDEGAFNGSNLDSKYVSYKDEYDLSLLDFEVLWDPSGGIMSRARFRPGYLDKLWIFRRLPYRDFSRFAQLSINPLRRARVGETVSGQTVLTILEGIRKVTSALPGLLTREEEKRDLSLVNQPSIVVLRQFGDSVVSRKSIEFHARRDWKNYFSSVGIDIPIIEEDIFED